jgi:hypothetical protein
MQRRKARRVRKRQRHALRGAGLCDVTVSEKQKTVHQVSEAVAVFLVTPFMIWLATREELPDWARVTSGAVALGTLAVDGWLLCRYSSGRTANGHGR